MDGFEGTDEGRHRRVVERRFRRLFESQGLSKGNQEGLMGVQTVRVGGGGVTPPSDNRSSKNKREPNNLTRRLDLLSIVLLRCL